MHVIVNASLHMRTCTDTTNDDTLLESFHVNEVLPNLPRGKTMDLGH